MSQVFRYIVGFILGAFGLLTLYLSGSVLFDLFDMRVKQGNYVNLIIRVNFVISLLYLVASYGIFKNKKWTTYLLEIALFILIMGGVGLFLHIKSGGLYEDKTPKALLFRFVVTGAFTLFSYFNLTRVKYK